MLLVFAVVATPLGQAAATRTTSATRVSEDARDLSKAAPESAGISSERLKRLDAGLQRFVDVQGYVVEKLSRQPFAEFLKTRLFDPLGMKDTAFYVPKDKAGRLARLHRDGPDGKRISPGRGFRVVMDAATAGEPVSDGSYDWYGIGVSSIRR